MSHQDNIIRIKAVSNALGPLKDEVVFVGGRNYFTLPDRRFFETRITDDVDVIIEIINYKGRAELEDRLRSLGFVHETDPPIICRYRVKGIVVDIMPTDDPTIGFYNKWYPDGFRHAVEHAIDEKHAVKILTAPYFIATKLEAFKGRGGGDGRTSQDFEDIVFVLENRSTIWEEIENSPIQLKEYLLDEFKTLADNTHIFEWIDAHVERGSPPASYIILRKIETLINKLKP